MTNRPQSLRLLGLLRALLAVVLVSPAAPATYAKGPSPAKADDAKPAPSVNQIKLGAGTCRVKDVPDTFDKIVAQSRKDSLVMDARPFAITQTTGRLTFNGNVGRVTVLNMNPFVYSYRISVAQKEIVSNVLNDFVNLLLPTALGKAVGFQSGTAGVTSAKANAISKAQLIEKRLEKYQKCTAPTAACDAINTINEAFGKISEELPGLESATSPRLGGQGPDDTYAGYTAALASVRDVGDDAYATCDKATALNKNLYALNLNDYFGELKNAQTTLTNLVARVDDLDEMIKVYKNDPELNVPKSVPRCAGFSCIDQFEKYVGAVRAILGGPTTGYQGALTRRIANAEEMQAMFRFTEEMKTKEGLFARTFEVTKKFELSEATVSINRGEPRPAQADSGNQSGTADGDPARGAGAAGGSGGTGSSGGSVGRGVGSVGGTLTAPGTQSGNATTPTPTPSPAAKSSGNSLASSGQVNEVITIGRPRFALSGGLVYSPLPRRTFQSVKGFARDAQGNPTGDGSANVVGFGENSSRRLLPMVMLNTRLADFDAASLFFSTGVSAKYDDNVDIEYLFGPSVGLLGNRVLFTGGLYGGLTQNLVADVAVGDVIPDSAGDAKLYRKTMTWKPGFSISYFFNRPPKQSSSTGGSGSGSGSGSSGTTTPAADVKEEIRIGSIPFNLAVGMIYSSLEQRTYNPVVGFARDRQGNLTNGRTLTRIVGLTSSSDSRLTPAVLLHSRLTDWGRHDFYFTTGLTGKKTDNNFDIEYLLGGSVNLYRRKLFVTFGAFAGKQQTLGGNFYEDAALAKTQGVTTQNRYVWKPAFSFSYDVTRFVPGSSR